MMRPVYVDAVRLQALEAAFHGGDQRLAAIAGDEPVGIGHGSIGELGGEHEILATSLQHRAQKLFRLPELVDVGRVDEIAAGLGIGVEDRLACVRVGAMTPACAEVSGAEGNLRDPQAGLSEQRVFHELFLSFEP